MGSLMRERVKYCQKHPYLSLLGFHPEYHVGTVIFKVKEYGGAQGVVAQSIVNR